MQNEIFHIITPCLSDILFCFGYIPLKKMYHRLSGHNVFQHSSIDMESDNTFISCLILKL